MFLLEKFGKSVLNYFLMNYSENTEFKLSIDDYTFFSCIENAEISEDELIKSLQRREISFNNPYEAIAIAAYQVEIAGDVESVTASGTDGYYQKIRDNYPQYVNCKYDSEIMNSYFKDCQIDLWNTVKVLFSSKGRILNIPNDHSGPGRYVQYPVKSHEISNTKLLKWADTFIQRKLLPNQMQITYPKFCEMFFPHYIKDSYKRTVWNFYCIWDGRSYNEIINRTHKTTGHQNKNDEFNILLEINESEIVFYKKDNGENILSAQIISPFMYSSTNIIYFKPFNESGLYESSEKPVELGSEIVLLSEKELLLKEDLLRQVTQKVDGLNITAYLCKTTKEICSLLKLRIQSATPPIRFVGGLKKRNGHYYSFALPVIEFTEPQTKAYINTTEISVKNNRIYLEEEFKKSMESKSGAYTLKLPDYIPVNFQIDEPERESDNAPDITGWSFMPPVVAPAKTNGINEKIICGFCANFKFGKIREPMQQEASRKRMYIQQLDRYKNRFVNQNIKQRMYIQQLNRYENKFIN